MVKIANRFQLRYPIFWLTIGSLRAQSTSAHGYRYFSPMAIGMKKRTIQIIVRAAAPRGRRIIKPHSPPVVYCSIRTASDPATMENQNR